MSAELTNYKAVYKKDPFSVSFNIDNLKNGDYYIEGDVSNDNWKVACEQIKVPHSGGCHIKCTVEKRGKTLHLFGKIKTKMTRNCVRTLKDFEESENLNFDEKVLIEEVDGDTDMNEAIHGSTLEMNEYLTEQIILHMNSYPIHPNTKSSKKGEFNVDDGQEKAINEEKEKKNPFSALKDLKFNS